jgi:hypothetical protein
MDKKSRAKLKSGDKYKSLQESRHLMANCTNKVRHPSVEDAELAIKKYYETVVLSVSPLSYYYCARHDCYHVGHDKTHEQLKEKWKQMNWWKQEDG